MQRLANDLVTLQGLAVSSVYEIAAIMAGLERWGVPRQAEVPEEIKRLLRDLGACRSNSGESWQRR